MMTWCGSGGVSLEGAEQAQVIWELRFWKVASLVPPIIEGGVWYSYAGIPVGNRGCEFWPRGGV